MESIIGLFPRSNQFKVWAFEEMASLNNVSIIALSETHLLDDIYDGEIDIDG